MFVLVAGFGANGGSDDKEEQTAHAENARDKRGIFGFGFLGPELGFDSFKLLQVRVRFGLEPASLHEWCVEQDAEEDEYFFHDGDVGDVKNAGAHEENRQSFGLGLGLVP